MLRLTEGTYVLSAQPEILPALEVVNGQVRAEEIYFIQARNITPGVDKPVPGVVQ